MVAMEKNNIKIFLKKRRLQHWQSGQVTMEYPIAIGKPVTPTPVGKWMVINKFINPGGVFGTRWMGISSPGVGIHGTNAPHMIGQMVSKGCIRMFNKDVEELYETILIGTAVEILP